MDLFFKPVVIDCGTSLVRAGFAHEDAKGPSCVFPTVLAKYADDNPSRVFVADKTASKFENPNLRFIDPIPRGVLKDATEFAAIMSHIFKEELRVCPKETSVLLAEPVVNPKHSRKIACEVLFEQFDITSMCFGNQSALTGYGSDKHSGLFVDIGDGLTQVVPVVNGSACKEASRQVPLAGKDITEYLANILSGSYHNIGDKGIDLLKCIKEDLCYVAEDWTNKKENPSNVKPYLLPDGSSVAVGKYAWEAPECLFEPELANHQPQHSIQRLVYDALARCKQYVKAESEVEIIITGGCTKLQGFSKRLDNELNTLRYESYRANREAARHKRIYRVDDNSAWLGGSRLMASSETFRSCRLFTKQDYFEYGIKIANMKGV